MDHRIVLVQRELKDVLLTSYDIELIQSNKHTITQVEECYWIG